MAGNVKEKFLFKKADIATLFGVSTEAVSKWMQAGLEPHSRSGREVLFYLPDVIAWRTQGFEDKGTGKVLNLNTERARLAKEQADKTTLENQKLRGELVDVDRVAQEWERIATAVKSKLLSLPTKAAPILQGNDSIPDIQDTLDNLIREALEELVNANISADHSQQVLVATDAAAETDSKSVGESI